MCIASSIRGLCVRTARVVSSGGRFHAWYFAALTFVAVLLVFFTAASFASNVLNYPLPANSPPVTALAFREPLPGVLPTKSTWPRFIYALAGQLRASDLVYGGNYTIPSTGVNAVASRGSDIVFAQGRLVYMPTVNGSTTLLNGTPQLVTTLSGDISALALDHNGAVLIASQVVNTGSKSGMAHPSAIFHNYEVSRVESLTPGSHPTVIAGGGLKPVSSAFQSADSIALGRIVGIASLPDGRTFIATLSNVLLLENGQIKIAFSAGTSTEEGHFVAIAGQQNGNLISARILRKSPFSGLETVEVTSGMPGATVTKVLLKKNQPHRFTLTVASDGTIFFGTGTEIKIISHTRPLTTEVQIKAERLLVSAFREAGERRAFVLSDPLSNALLQADWPKVHALLTHLPIAESNVSAFMSALEHEYVRAQLAAFRERLGKPVTGK